jgi:pimeloyl-ACP methyl ester carboxylesterase
LRVAYRASAPGDRDIVFVSNWFTCCELFPELPSTRGWVEAMTSLGRRIFFDQPGTGASDPVTPDTLPTVEQWADSITAVLDELGSREAVLVTYPGAIATTALFAATHPSRTAALVVLNGQADPPDRTGVQDDAITTLVATWGTGELQHLVVAADHRVECARNASECPRAHTCRPAHRQPAVHAGGRPVHRRPD